MFRPDRWGRFWRTGLYGPNTTRVISQTNLAAATIAEGAAEAASIKKMREAMMNEGGLIQVKMAIAENLRGKRIIMIPTGNANSFNLQTLDLNDILRQLGVTKPK